MTADHLGPGPRTRVRRLSDKARYEESVINAILDEARLCHVAAIVNGSAMTLPTLHARDGRTLYLHGSQSNVIMKAIAERAEAWISVALYDGLRLARSGFESSIAYRSVTVFGAARIVDDEVEKARVLELFVDRILPGRAAEVRPMTKQEQRLTLVLAISMDEASAKVSAGPTDDALEDMALQIWSGTVPARLDFGTPIPSTDGAMSSGDVSLPESVRRLLDKQ
jgi:nitroimidazol reductase NimA-like FMN-containing flavoprotein (pyridoxamine 5'-phosphate oxidase superfamily)